ncbi:MAG TPA: amino acid adenylation domain-containing protein, partial [Telluria sp.]|nr:amino acid adenylation domain-containing protein [Telluria sp.]
ANRQSRETEPLIGFFINTLAIRVRLDDDPSAATLLEQIKATTLDAYAHQDLPFEQVFERLQPVRSLSHSPIFQVMLALNNTPRTRNELPGLTLEPVASPRVTSYFDLSLFLSDAGGTLSGTLEYARSLFERSSAERIARQFQCLLRAMLADATLPISRLPLLDADDRHRLLVEFNASTADFAQDVLIQELFEERVAAQPEATAVIAETGPVTYAELNRRANRLAHHLRALGVKPDDRVGLCVERSLDMIVGMLGILKSGGGYVPLDPAYPADRLAYMVKDSAPVALLTQTALRGTAPASAGMHVLELDDPATRALLAAQPDHSPGRVQGPHHLAYIIYTSGSTGAPKGVMLEHRNVVNLIQGHVAMCGLTPADRVMQFASISFDNSVVEIFPCLSAGAALVLRPSHIMTPDQEFVDFLATHRITVTDLPTAFWHQWAQEIRAGRSIPGSHLRLALAGGEKSELRHLMAWFSEPRMRNTRWINTYGPTEAAVNAAVLAFDGGSTLPAHDIPIGRPVANAQLYVLDEHGAPAPIGVAGEIHIAGAGVARGYLNRPELTAERFVADPFRPGGRMYKTGDLGRWLTDGTIEYIGRNDFQVKIRGFRIELGEIEARLASCAGVREAVVIAREDSPGDKRLVAYLIADPELGQPLAAAELRSELAASLPEYMLPAAFVQLDAFPISPNGKLDRKALPAPDQTSVIVREYEAPEGPVETTVAAVWRDLLKLDRVGRNDHFFELGGHSLLVVGVIERLRQQGITASVRSMFAAPVLRELAALLGEAAPAAAAFTAPPNRIPAGCAAITSDLLPLADLTQDEIDRVVATVPGGAGNVQDIYPLAPLQQGILFHHLLENEGDAYILRSVTRFDNRARLQACLSALQQVIDRHDSWRSAIHWQGLRQAVQVVLRRAPLPVEELGQATGEAAMARLLEHTDPRHSRMDLTRAPLLAVAVIEDAADGSFLMALLQHHIVTDHVTVGLAMQELRLILEDRAAELPVPIPYRNFVAKALATPLAASEAWFRQQLGGIDEPTAPFGVLDIQGDGAGVTELVHTLPRILSQRLRAAARKAGVSAAVLFHVAWARVVAQTSGRDDVVFGTTLSGRLDAASGAEHVFGMFINTLPVRLPGAGMSARDAVAHAYQRLGELLAHEQAPLALAQRCSGVAASAPLFTSLLNYHRTAGGGRAPAWEGMRMLFAEERTNYPITVSVDDVDDDFMFIIQCVDGIDPVRVNGYFATALGSLADALEREPRMPLERLRVLPEAERDALLGTAITPPTFDAFLLHRRFEQRAAAAPEDVAVTCDGVEVSYADLNRRANRIAHRLLAIGVRPDERVALCMERGIDLIAGLLGILKAGGAYVPLDPVYPDERLAYMLEDSRPLAIVTQDGLRGRFATSGLPLVCAGDDGAADHNPDVAALTPNHLAYIIYTSGSTGMPKGVMIEHAHVARLFAATDADFGFGPADVWTLFHSFAFDFSVWEIFGALLHGGRLVIVPSLCARDPAAFHALLCRERVTVLNQTPTAFRQLIAADAGAQDRLALRCIVFGGEALELHTLAPWIARHDPERTRLVNMYGITETTVHVTYRALSAADIHGSSGSAIGVPIADLRVYVLDRHGNPVPAGVAGEMFVAGAGVARGYLNRPELSSERFLPDPFHPGGRMYKTGDLARRLPDGSLEYLGRNDFQVKIRGFRIELGEIEAKLAACAGVREAVVIAREDVPGDKRLVAYVLADEEWHGDALPVAVLRAELATLLPEHMLPAAIVQLDAFPLTPNGKLDRQALPAPDQAAVTARAYEAPAGETETTIAAIWQDLLGIERVGRHDHFFELGGHSLLVVSLIERLRQVSLATDVRTIFTAPTVAALALAIGAHGAATHEAPPNLITSDAGAITPAMLPLIDLTQSEIDALLARVPGGVGNVQDIYPLGPLQEGILFHHLLEAEGDAYLLRTTLAFDTRARMDAFLGALQGVIDRHDILRTAVHWHGLRQAVQVVQRRAALPVEELAAGADAHARLMSHTDPRHTRIDLTRAPLIAATVAQDSATGEWLMALRTHHLIDDNYTLQLMLSEVKTILVGEGAHLPPSQPYRNFIAQVRSVPEHEHESYFRAQLGDVSEPTAPFGVLDIQGNGEHIEEASIELDAALAARVRACARSQGVTAAVLFHAAWAQVLARCSGRDDVVFGTTLSGRLQGSAGADSVLGMFINTLPLRLPLAGRDVRGLVAETYRRLGELLSHEQASLALAQRCSAVEAPLPLFTSLLNYRHTRMVAGATSRPLQGVRLLGGEERTNFPFTLSVNDLEHGFVVNAQCVRSIGAARMAGYLVTALDRLTAALQEQPEQPAHTLPILPEAELAQLAAFNATARPYPAGVLLHQLVETQAEARPDATAVVFENTSLSYAGLNRRANQLAHRLIALGVKPDQRVAIC